MAKSKNIVFTGKAHWARVYEGNHDEYGGKEFYKVTAELDGNGWSKFNQSGLSLKSKPVSSESEELGVTFKRDIHAKTGTDKKGKTWSLGGGAPRVVDKDGQPMEDLIGNGSKCEFLVNIYQVSSGPMKGKWGHRLEAIKVLELVPYEPNEDDDDTTEESQEDTSSSTKNLPF